LNRNSQLIQTRLIRFKLKRSQVFTFLKGSAVRITGFILLFGLFLLLGYQSYFWITGKLTDSTFEHMNPEYNVVTSSSSTSWNIPAQANADTSDYSIKVRNLVLDAQNRLSFSLIIPQAPVKIESTEGTQLGKQIFVIPEQTFHETGEARFSEISLEKFNPFEAINLVIRFRYDNGVSATSKIQFTIN